MKVIDIASLVRENVKKLKPYSSARDEFKGSASVYLDANENPFGSAYNRYPDPHQVELKKKIAAIKKVNADQIFLGNGSDEPIDLLFRAFCEPGLDNVMIPQPTYGMYSVSAGINNVLIKSVNLTADFDLDVEATAGSWDARTRLLFLCSPNNPSGNLLDGAKIKSLLSRFEGLVVVDEAYIDFTDNQGFVSELGAYNNLVVLQTLSKAWGLAGIRLGICLASPEIVRVLDRIKPPYNISSHTQSVARQSLENEDIKNRWVSLIREQREWMKMKLASLSSVKKVYPSDANFLLVRIDDAAQVYSQLVGMGIIVRDRSNVVLCDDCLRITIGLENENKNLFDALTRL